MYVCINCGAERKELYRRYCPSVLKILKCEKCDLIADKYIEYDPVIVFVDLILIEKPAYRHLLYNSKFKSYWKLCVILWIFESFRAWISCDTRIDLDKNAHDNCNFYDLLIHTALAFTAFIYAVIVTTELKWFIGGKKPYKYNVKDLIRALTIGGCGKLLGCLGIVWRHIASGPYYLLVQGYTVLCLFTAYSVVCKSGKGGSLTGLIAGFLVYGYICISVSNVHIRMPEITLI
ncbi:protein ARV1 [Pseudomyrmex gracilis]|uniref:protein ARV1 n=1 Tax=Pseudomyrmex gracilis TaxID=219809 RepID=UPI000994B2B7|nr:protein ARV1 [Pseudomyrmex gracilis]XP_020281253.1 protein ARV1 [Pseudomyrmex gracilis]XP_020281254.1 protein ARV1 [Pseudomyrmex gracilis]XP_020281255.1 protein ARV1 [Pseudomyrmex gracilis]XP_020281256.1 protein ARV1 [Pseudomyrmex gracilis]XP_020281257.1 protein ARV1 [Pseudomyrmex gracilis]XP_020281258.1 protein ARV1 [Pseudomyrmex gracilis]